MSKAVRVFAVVSLGLALGTLLSTARSQDEVAGDKKAKVSLTFETDPQVDWRFVFGISKDAKPFRLTLEDAVGLAIIKHRRMVAGEKTAEPIDLTRLVALKDRYHVNEFVLFERDLRESKGGNSDDAFQDPTEQYLNLLAECSEIERLHWESSAWEQIAKGLKDHLGRLKDQSEVPPVGFFLGPAPLSIGWAPKRADALQSLLDELKVHLGLPVEAPIELDQGPLELFQKLDRVAFRLEVETSDTQVFEAILKALPRIQDVMISGESLLNASRTEPTELNRFMEKACSSVQPGFPKRTETWKAMVRKRVRLLRGLALDYNLSSQKAARAIFRLRGQCESLAKSFENEAVIPTVLIQYEITMYRLSANDYASARYDSERKWIDYQIARAAFLLELGTIPGENWKDYWQNFHAQP